MLLATGSNGECRNKQRRGGPSSAAPPQRDATASRLPGRDGSLACGSPMERAAGLQVVVARATDPWRAGDEGAS